MKARKRTFRGLFPVWEPHRDYTAESMHPGEFRDPPNPPAQPHQSLDPLARVAEHARSVVAADGAEDWPEGLVREVARALAPHLAGGRDYDGMPHDRRMLRDWLLTGKTSDINDATRADADNAALAALRVVREWEGRE